MNLICEMDRIVEFIVIVIMVIVGLVKGPIQLKKAHRTAKELSDELDRILALVGEEAPPEYLPPGWNGENFLYDDDIYDDDEDDD